MRRRSVDAREEAGARNAHVCRCYVLFLLRDLYLMADGDHVLETPGEGDDVRWRGPVGTGGRGVSLRSRGGLRPGRAGKADEEGKGQYRNSHGMLHLRDLSDRDIQKIGARPATTHHSHILDTSVRLHRKDGPSHAFIAQFPGNSSGLTLVYHPSRLKSNALRCIQQERCRFRRPSCVGPAGPRP